MSSPSHSEVGPTDKEIWIKVGIGTALWLIGAAVAGHLAWDGVPWIVVLLLAAMAELIVLTAWLVGSTLHDPAKRWELPPNPADAQRGWRGALTRVRGVAQGAGSLVRSRLLRRQQAKA